MDAVNPPNACESRIAGIITKGSNPKIISVGVSIVPYPIPNDESINSQIKANKKSNKNKPTVTSIILLLLNKSFINFSICFQTVLNLHLYSSRPRQEFVLKPNRIAFVYNILLN